MQSPRNNVYAQVTAFEKACAFGHAFLLPGVIFWNVWTWYFHPETRAKGLSRHISDVSLNHLTKLETPRLQYMLGTTEQAYRTWTRKSGVPLLEEDLGEDAKLYWVGPRRTDRVILYLHGGAYMFPVSYQGLSFWKYIQEQLGEKGHCDTGLAILQYTLMPCATFPNQLTQTVIALRRLIASGVSPRNIHIGGDSAGGNLALQLVSHLLHPVEGVPALDLDTPLRSVCLISPWVLMDDCYRHPSFKGPFDFIAPSTAARWGREVLSTEIPDEYTPYIQPLKAPEDWFQEMNKVADRILVVTGDLDLLKDQAIEMKGILEQHHSDVKFIFQENGTHTGPYYDFNSPSNPAISNATVHILDWFASGF